VQIAADIRADKSRTGTVNLFRKPDDQQTQNGVSRIASRPELSGP